MPLLAFLLVLNRKGYLREFRKNMRNNLIPDLNDVTAIIDTPKIRQNPPQTSMQENPLSMYDFGLNKNMHLCGFDEYFF